MLYPFAANGLTEEAAKYRLNLNKSEVIVTDIKVNLISILVCYTVSKDRCAPLISKVAKSMFVYPQGSAYLSRSDQHWQFPVPPMAKDNLE